MVDYNNGKIYKILNTINDEVYVGSTTQSLAKRMSWHRNSLNSKRSKKQVLYQYMKEYGVDNFYIELVECFSCKSKEELLAREGHWIRCVGTLNCRVSGRTKEQYRQDNRDMYAESSRKYYQNKKEQIKEKQVEKIQCECGLFYSRANKNQHVKTLIHSKRMNNIDIS